VVSPDLLADARDRTFAAQDAKGFDDPAFEVVFRCHRSIKDMSGPDRLGPDEVGRGPGTDVSVRLGVVVRDSSLMDTRESQTVDENSKRSRVDPVFGWLHQHGGPDWPARLVALAQGLGTDINPGPLENAQFEVGVPASQERLDWLLARANQLGHSGPRLEEIIRRAGTSDPRLRVLEGTTYADCLIECERAIIWIEGKRHDWLSPGTKWDPNRDQLARNLEAAWISARARQKEAFCVLILHEFPLRTDEQALVDGYRSGSLLAGFPHLADDVRRDLARRIGTLTWGEIVEEWPAMRGDERLASVASE
jgi:hypothetical protein